MHFPHQKIFFRQNRKKQKKNQNIEMNIDKDFLNYLEKFFFPNNLTLFFQFFFSKNQVKKKENVVFLLFHYFNLKISYSRLNLKQTKI